MSHAIDWTRCMPHSVNSAESSLKSGWPLRSKSVMRRPSEVTWMSIGFWSWFSRCRRRKNSAATELRKLSSTCFSEELLDASPSAESFGALELLLSLLKGMTPEWSSIGDENGLWKYFEVAIRIFLSWAEIHNTRKSAIIAVMKSAKATFHAPP